MQAYKYCDQGHESAVNDAEQRSPERIGGPMGGIRRRSFKRAPEGERRQDLVRATMDCVCDLGLQATTVRAVATRAGVTNGLIRHYFSTKVQMIQEAYKATIDGMTATAKATIDPHDASPATRLRLFIAANLSPPVVNPRTLSLWASFISLIHVDQAMADIHRDGYIDFRRVLERLVGALFADAGRPIPQSERERHAIKINALIDGLWLEGCLAGEIFKPDALPALGIEAVESILGMPLKDPS